MKEEELINSIRNYPHLYLLSDKHYHNQQMKDNAWEEISNEMTTSVEECKKKWKNLKDCYRKSNAKKRNKSGDSAESIPKKWRYEDEMSFLLPNIQERTQKSNIDAPTDHVNEQEQSEICENENDENSANTLCSPGQENDDTMVLLSPSCSNANVSKPKRSQKAELKTAEILQKFLENKEKRKTVDHISKFFESAEETTRSLPRELQIEIKHRISSLLYEFELKAVTAEVNTTSTSPSD